MNETVSPNNADLSEVRWIEVADTEALHQAATVRILNAAARAIQQRGQFLIVLAGGNTPRGVYEKLHLANTDWSCWQIYFGDERCLPLHDPKRNSTMAADAWLDHVSIPKQNVHTILAELGPLTAAKLYTDALRNIDNFDLVLLGLGEDGHTASLFPGHDEDFAPNAPDVIAIFDASKPPPQRVSLSAARLSRASEVLFLIDGESKRAAITSWRVGAPIPARAIRPAAGIDVLVIAKLLHPLAKGK